MREFLASVRRRMRIALCWMVNGRHELHRAHSDCRLFQRCVCGYETTGWTIDRRDRRIHIVRGNHAGQRRERRAVA